MALLEIKNLAVKYGVIPALKDISLQVEAGAAVAVIGANGAGKTTTLQAVSGVVPKSGGQVFLRAQILQICRRTKLLP